MSRHVSQGLGFPPPGHLADHHTTSDHRQIGRQGTFGPKSPQCSEIVSQQRQKHLRTQVVNVVGRQSHAASVRSVIDHVDEQSDEPIHEIPPRAGMMVQATFEQAAINFGKCQEIARKGE